MATAEGNPRKRKPDQGDIRAFFGQRQQGNYSATRNAIFVRLNSFAIAASAWSFINSTTNAYIYLSLRLLQ